MVIHHFRTSGETVQLLRSPSTTDKLQTFFWQPSALYPLFPQLYTRGNDLPSLAGRATATKYLFLLITSSFIQLLPFRPLEHPSHDRIYVHFIQKETAPIIPRSWSSATHPLDTKHVRVIPRSRLLYLILCVHRSPHFVRHHTEQPFIDLTRLSVSTHPTDKKKPIIDTCRPHVPPLS